MLNLNYSHFTQQKLTGLAHFGIKNFKQTVLDYKSTMKLATSLSNEATSCLALPDSTLKKIKNLSIDFFPCDYIYAAQNKVNWQPRTTLGAALSPSLMDNAAQNFSSKNNAVDFILWSLQSEITYDNRYFLNDEPKAVYNILNHYNIIEQNESFLLFENKRKPNFGQKKLDNKITAQFNQWIDIKYNKSEVLRLRMLSSTNFYGNLKKTLYKDELYFIDYITEKNDTLSYRLLLPATKDGIWINPLVRISNANNNITKENITKIRFRTTNDKCVHKNIQLQFEHIPLKDNYKLFEK